LFHETFLKVDGRCGIGRLVVVIRGRIILDVDVVIVTVQVTFPGYTDDATSRVRVRVRVRVGVRVKVRVRVGVGVGVRVRFPWLKR